MCKHFSNAYITHFEYKNSIIKTDDSAAHIYFVIL